MADEGPAAAGLTREQAAEILREALPGARVVGVERFAGGFEAGTYEVLCEDPLQNAVVKVYRKDDGWKLLKEISVYRLLGENAVTLTPKLLGGAGPKGAKTHGYSIRDNRVKLDGFFEGYGEVPVEWERRFRLFQLVHAFELWGFFHGIGALDKLDPIAEEMRALITAS